jgi:hypothetical protein
VSHKGSVRLVESRLVSADVDGPSGSAGLFQPFGCTKRSSPRHPQSPSPIRSRAPRVALFPAVHPATAAVSSSPAPGLRLRRRPFFPSANPLVRDGRRHPHTASCQIWFVVGQPYLPRRPRCIAPADPATSFTSPRPVCTALPTHPLPFLVRSSRSGRLGFTVVSIRISYSSDSVTDLLHALVDSTCGLLYRRLRFPIRRADIPS